jgi:glutathione S-transferase
MCKRFTYADIAAAQVLQFVSPVAASYRAVRIGKANRECFEHPKLAPEYRDLVAWRDALYARHRGRGATVFVARDAQPAPSAGAG